MDTNFIPGLSISILKGGRNATNDRNEPVSAGPYLYTIQFGEFRQTKKMVFLK